MKFKYYTLAVVLLMASCSKELTVEKEPDLDVTTESSTYKVGQEIVFKFTGDASLISLYSGQEANDYTYRDGKVIDVAGGVEMSFTSAVSVVNAALQNNQLAIVASTDFNGQYDIANIRKATWTDITSRFVVNGATAAFVASGVKDISDLITDPSKPIYIAFKYTTRSQAVNGLARQHQLQSFLVSSKGPRPAGFTKPLTLTDQATAGFTIVDENKANAPGRSSLISTRVTLYGNIYKDLTRKDPVSPIWDPNDPIFDPLNPKYVPGSPEFDQFAKRPIFVPFDPASPYNDPVSEQWAITKPITVNKIDLGPDRAIAIKAMENGKLSQFLYTYPTPGVYKAVFVFSNHTLDEVKQKTKEISLTITP
jgi:hypothetical protein